MKVLSFLKEHLVLCIVIFNLILVGITIGIAVNQATKTATIDILVAPVDAKITLNGTTFENSTTTDIHPGTYEVKIEKEGLKTKTETLEIANNSFTQLRDYLINEDNSFDYYKTHKNDFDRLKQVAKEDDEKAKTFIKNYERIAGIINSLPLEYYDRAQENPIGIYIEQTTENCPEIVCLIIHTKEENKNLAYSLITNAGYNPNDYQISFGEK